MKKIGLLLVIMALSVWGCVTADNTTLIDTDQHGYAGGQYRDVHHGKVADVDIFGGGAGASASGGGGGALGLMIHPAPTQGDPLPFARSIAMINYSRRLSSIKYDESGGIIEYEFNSGPQAMGTGYAPPKAQMPSSFGYQPIE
jgi:hypothetical protein